MFSKKKKKKKYDTLMDQQGSSEDSVAGRRALGSGDTLMGRVRKLGVVPPAQPGWWGGGEPSLTGAHMWERHARKGAEACI